MLPRMATNILVIMSDQHSRFVSGAYGDELVRTPNLDRLAGEGMALTDAYCAAPLCVPSRMSFMTSRFPKRNRVWGNHHVLSSSIPTWAHLLGAAGYETALIGRMHFVGSDHRHGFEKRPHGEHSAVYPGADRKGGPRWTKIPRGTAGQSRISVENAGRGHNSYQWYDECVTDEACSFLKQKAVGNDDRPFAYVVGYVQPHCPYVAPKELFDYYYDRVGIPVVEEHQPATISRFRDVRGILDPPLPEERVRVARAAYYGLCEHLDSLIGKVLACLEETGLDEDTLVVYTSDHGEMAGEHGCWWKSSFYEGSAGVPLIVRWPGVVAAGSRSSRVCNLVDLGATFAEIAGATFKPESDGRSLMPVLGGDESGDWKDETFSELVDFNNNNPYSLPCRMVRSGPWKLWTYADQQQLPPALFNLETDPHERNDLGLDPEYRDVREQLLAKVHENWDAEIVRAEADEKLEEFETLAAWGKALQPESPDAFPEPNSDKLERDVELL